MPKERGANHLQKARDLLARKKKENGSSSLIRDTNGHTLKEHSAVLDGAVLSPEFREEMRSNSEFVQSELVEDDGALNACCQRFTKSETLSVDTETIGLEYWKNPIRLISITNEEGYTWLVDLWKVSKEPKEALIRRLEEKRLLFHNALYDLLILGRLGMGWPKGGVVCTQLLSQIYWAGDLSKSSSLSAVAKRDVQETVYDFEEGKEDWSVHNITPDLCDYAARDTKYLGRIEEKLLERLASTGGLVWVVDTEMKVLKAMVGMSAAGMPVNVKKLGEFIEASEAYKVELFAELDAYVDSLEEGMPDKFLENNEKNKNVPAERKDRINWQSTEQVAWVLDRLGVEYPIKEETGNPSLNKDTFPDIDHPIAIPLSDIGPLKSDIPKWRNALKNRLNVDRLMAEWRQLGARSGRMSCKNPPLQGLPNEGQVRYCIEAPEGMKLISSDLSKIEVKIWAAISEDPVLIAEFKAGGDIYKKLAARVMEKEETQVSEAEREACKAIVLGRIYGMGIPATTTRIRKILNDHTFTQKRTKRILNSIETNYRKARRWRKKQETRKYDAVTTTRTPRGRIRRKVSNNRQRFNTPIQGSASDCFKAIVAAIQELVLERYEGVQLVGLVHDEVLLVAPEAIAREVAELVDKIMQEVGDEVVNADSPEELRVPVDAETYVCKNLGEKKKGERVAS